MFALVRTGRVDQRRISTVKHLALRSTGSLRTLRRLCRLDREGRRSKEMRAAGLRSSFAEEIFFAAQLSGVLFGALCGGYSTAGSLVAVAAGAICGFWIPGLWLTVRNRKRRAKIRSSVPDMVDLLVICVGAGLGLDQALLRVGDDLHLSHPEITEELGRLSLERQAGTPRLEAWQALAQRAQVEELFSFTNVLAETDRFGTPITKALSDFAEDLRTKRKQRAEEAAAKTKVKIIFPLVLCIFPCIFVVLLLPALLHLVRDFSGMSY